MVRGSAVGVTGWKVPTFSYFLGFLLLFPTLGSNSYFFLLFFRILPNLSPKNAIFESKNFFCLASLGINFHN